MSKRAIDSQYHQEEKPIMRYSNMPPPFSNYETWYVKSWILNCEDHVEYWTRVGRDLYIGSEPGYPGEREILAQCKLTKLMQDHYEETLPEMPDSLALDLLYSALNQVRWYQIAEHILGFVLYEVEKSAPKKTKETVIQHMFYFG
jgi:hypothetical protein